MARIVLRALAASSLAAAAILVASNSGAAPSGSNVNESVSTAGSITSIAQQLVGSGVAISHVQFVGSASARGTFAFSDPTVVGITGGVILSSGDATQVVGPNTSDSNSTDWSLPGDSALSALAGFPTHDAAILSFDFVPTTNQIAFQYAFGSDEYPEWVNTQYNDVFAFWVTNHAGVTNNCAVVRKVAGDPTSPMVPVAINNINQSNPVQSPPPISMRPDLFRPNYFGSSTIDLELDGITKVLTCQSNVTAGQTNHMRLAIADSSDGIYDSAVFIKATSLVSNSAPIAEFGFDPSPSVAPAATTASIDSHDPNNLPLTYSVNWGDGAVSSPATLPTDTAVVHHTYVYAGKYAATLTVSNGSSQGTACDEFIVTGAVNPGTTANETCDVSGTGVATTGPPPPTFDGLPGAPGVDAHPSSMTVPAGATYQFTAMANGTPNPTVQWQMSTDGGNTFKNLPGETHAKLSGGEVIASLSGVAQPALNHAEFQAVYTNQHGQDVTDPATLTVRPAVFSVVLLAPKVVVGQSQAVTFVVTTKLSGTVAIYDGPKYLRSTSVIAGLGKSSVSWSSVGFHALTFRFTAVGGKAKYDSKIYNVQVNVAKTKTTETVARLLTTRGALDVVKATVVVVSPGHTSLTAGTFSLRDGTTVIAKGVHPSSLGVFSFGWKPTAKGIHKLTVLYSGSATAGSSNSAIATVTVH